MSNYQGLVGYVALDCFKEHIRYRLAKFSDFFQRPQTAAEMHKFLEQFYVQLWDYFISYGSAERKKLYTQDAHSRLCSDMAEAFASLESAKLDGCNIRVYLKPLGSVFSVKTYQGAPAFAAEARFQIEHKSGSFQSGMFAGYLTSVFVEQVYKTCEEELARTAENQDKFTLVAFVRNFFSQVRSALSSFLIMKDCLACPALLGGPVSEFVAFIPYLVANVQMHDTEKWSRLAVGVCGGGVNAIYSFTFENNAHIFSCGNFQNSDPCQVERRYGYRRTTDHVPHLGLQDLCFSEEEWERHCLVSDSVFAPSWESAVLKDCHKVIELFDTVINP